MQAEAHAGEQAETGAIELATEEARERAARWAGMDLKSGTG